MGAQFPWVEFHRAQARIVRFLWGRQVPRCSHGEWDPSYWSAGVQRALVRPQASWNITAIVSPTGSACHFLAQPYRYTAVLWIANLLNLSETIRPSARSSARVLRSVFQSRSHRLCLPLVLDGHTGMETTRTASQTRQHSSLRGQITCPRRWRTPRTE